MFDASAEDSRTEGFSQDYDSVTESTTRGSCNPASHGYGQ